MYQQFLKILISKKLLLSYLAFVTSTIFSINSTLAFTPNPLNTSSLSSIYKPKIHQTYTYKLNHATSIVPPNSFKKDAIEIAKIMTMVTITSITYGIVHDLITTQINFDYFASDRTHHGPYTRENFPFIYKTNSKVLYALLWGTISTWWVGLPLGIIWGIAARCNPEKLGWHDLVKPMLFFSSGMLTASIIVGLINYSNHKYSFRMVAAMHKASYIIGIIGGIHMAFCIYNYTPEKSTKENIVQFEPNSISINLVQLFKNK
jgi:hypothetical protein